MSDQRIALQRASRDMMRAKPAHPQSLGFGRHFTDHFFITEFDRPRGWHSPRIEPARALQLDPASLCLHYGQQVFEGLKAYRGRDDGLYLFRWQKNAERLNNSGKRLVMETVDPSLFGRAIKALVLLEQDWIPRDPSCSLYIRPTLLATDPYLGVRPGDEYLFYVIVGPVGAYYSEGFNPVRIWVSEEDVRAVKGGLGEAKTGANYAHSLAAQKKAAAMGYSQVLWLDAVEHRYVEEVGTMNIFFLIKDELVTPPLGGTIIPGVTRDSVLQIAKRWGVTVRERPILIDEVIEAIKTGALQEAFGTGTAAVVAPVGTLLYRGQEYLLSQNKTGPLTKRLYDFLTRLQHGEEDDPFGWVERIDRLDLAELVGGAG